MGEAFRALGDREICLRLVMKGVGIRGIRDMVDVMEMADIAVTDQNREKDWVEYFQTWSMVMNEVLIHDTE